MLKKLFLWLHRWLGLFSGLIITIIGLTGCLTVFSDELKELFYKDRLFVEAKTEHTLPLSVLQERAQQALGSSYKISRSEIYPQYGRSWIFRASKTDPEAIGHWNYYKYYYRAYVNPYNGEVIYIEDSRNEFFQLVLSLHMNLLLGQRIGAPLVGYSVALFVLILISGVIIWWPKDWKIKKIKKNFLVKWNASRKRLNYDLHNVLSIYILIPILISALTGLIFAFKWTDSSMQYIFNGGKKSVERVIPSSPPPLEIKADRNTALDKALYTVLREKPEADLLSIRVRPKKTAPIDIQTRLLKSRTHIFVWYYFDSNNGNLLMKYGNEDLSGGEKLRSMNYDLHVGSFGGIGTKIIAFFSALICTSLPITGFFIWYNKRAKKKKRVAPLSIF